MGGESSGCPMGVVEPRSMYPCDIKGVQLANAHLIAAAPEMYWALNDIKDFLRRSGYDTTLVASVIAKAEGREAPNGD